MDGWQAMVQGGDPLVIGTVIASFVVLTVGLERLWTVSRFRRGVSWLDERLTRATSRGDLGEALRIAERAGGGLRTVFVAGLDRAQGRAKGEPLRAMQREQRRAVGDLRASMWVLGTAATMMPFLGLLGTVLGVMEAFQQIGESGASGFAVVAGGISTALIATAAGLAVALEAVLFYNYLQSAITASSRELALLVDEVAEDLSLSGGAHDGAPPA